MVGTDGGCIETRSRIVGHISSSWTKDSTVNGADENFSSFNRIIRLKIIRDKMGLDRGLDFGVDPLLEKIIVKANNLVNTWDGKLFFVYLPDKERYSKGKIKNDSYLKRSQIINLIKKLNIPLIDIHEDFFVMQNDPISFYAERIYGHYSPEGYSKISKTIIKKVRELNSF